MKKLNCATILIVVILLMPGLQTISAFAENLGQQTTLITPQYEITNQITASLSISASGTATCIGKVKAKSASSTCSITTKLMRKVGTSWQLVDSWSNTGSGVQGVKAKGTYAVSPGTYKVSVSATVTAIDGTKESVSKSTGEKTYTK